MKGLVLAVGTSVGLFGFGDTASAQYHHGHYHGGGYQNGGWAGGHYHFTPAHFHYHPDPWGGHLHYHGPQMRYHRGPDVLPVYGGYRGYGYQPGFSLGFQYYR